MPVRTRTVSCSALLLVLAALLLNAPADAGATKTTAFSANTLTLIRLKGSKGWSIVIEGHRLGQKRRAQTVDILATGPGHETVTYNLYGRVDADGSVRAKLPGVGRIDLAYEATKPAATGPTSKNCAGSDAPTASTGVFRGTIKINGEGGYTEVDRSSAKGSVSTSPSKSCTRTETGSAKEAGKVATEPQFELVGADRSLSGGRLSFAAVDLVTHSSLLPPRILEFGVDYTSSRAGMRIQASTAVEGKPADLSILAPEGTPTEAKVAPPAPFEGSGTLLSGASGKPTWTGDLRVPIPTLGMTELTGSDFDAFACLGQKCTGQPSP